MVGHLQQGDRAAPAEASRPVSWQRKQRAGSQLVMLQHIEVSWDRHPGIILVEDVDAEHDAIVAREVAESVSRADPMLEALARLLDGCAAQHDACKGCSRARRCYAIWVEAVCESVDRGRLRSSSLDNYLSQVRDLGVFAPSLEQPR